MCCVMQVFFIDIEGCWLLLPRSRKSAEGFGRIRLMTKFSFNYLTLDHDKPVT